MRRDRLRDLPLPSALLAVALPLLLLLLLGACSDSGGPTGPDSPNQPGAASGTISGTVTVVGWGSALPGATVTTLPSTATATTDTLGKYTLSSVPVGSYQVTASRTGYTSASASVAVTAGQTVTADLALTPPAGQLAYDEVATLQGPAEAIASLAISPDGRIIAFGTFADNSVRLVDVATRQVTRTLTGHTNRVTELAFSPDARTLATTGTVSLSPGDGSVRTWDVTTGNQLASVSTSGVSQLRFSPSGGALAGASGGDPLRVRLWTPANLAEIRTLSGVFRIVAFSPDGSRIVSAARNERVYLMDYNTGSEVATFTGHTGWVTAAAFSANGQMLVTAGDDRRVLIRDASTGQVTRTITGHTTYPDFVAFSPDGTVLASRGSGTNITRIGNQINVTISSADRFIRLWNLITGEELARVNIATDILSEVSFSGDWSLLVTGSNQGLIRIFRRRL